MYFRLLILILFSNLAYAKGDALSSFNEYWSTFDAYEHNVLNSERVP